MKTFYVVGGNALVTNMMERLGYKQAKQSPAQIMIWAGGADVNPKLYAHVPHPTTAFDSVRDLQDGRAWETVKNLPQLLKIGICRGAQFLCTRNGGTLWQDVDNHAIGGTHNVVYRDKENTAVYRVTSTHHQMMCPHGMFNVDYERWALANLATYRDFGWERRRKVLPLEGPDNEVIFFPKTRSLCFQPHPEYHGADSTLELFKTCLDRALKR